MGKWIKTSFPGVRYREHPIRKHGVRPDRYFTIRYKLDGRDKEEGLGWSSQGMTAKKAGARLAELKENQRIGQGARTLQERRKRERERREREKAEKERLNRENFTFGELMALYLEWAKNNKKHWSNDEYRYRIHLAPFMADKPLKKITPFLLEKAKKSLQDKGLAPATVKHCLVIVRQAFNKAILWQKWHGGNPIKGLKLPQADNAKLRAITPEEETRLMGALKEKSPDTHDMAMTSLYSGLRFAEVAGLHWEDVDFTSDRITVRAGKGGKSRIVPMCRTLKKIFQERKTVAPVASGLVFPNRNGGIQGKVSATFPRTVEQLGLNEDTDKRFRLDFHSLRHSYTTRLASQGTPLHVLRDLLGHADFQMVSRYSHLIPSQAQDAVNALDKRSGQHGAKVMELRP